MRGVQIFSLAVSLTLAVATKSAAGGVDNPMDGGHRGDLFRSLSDNDGLQPIQASESASSLQSVNLASEQDNNLHDLSSARNGGVLRTADNSGLPRRVGDRPNQRSYTGGNFQNLGSRAWSLPALPSLRDLINRNRNNNNGGSLDGQVRSLSTNSNDSGGNYIEMGELNAPPAETRIPPTFEQYNHADMTKDNFVCESTGQFIAWAFRNRKKIEEMRNPSGLVLSIQDWDAAMSKRDQAVRIVLTQLSGAFGAYSDDRYPAQYRNFARAFASIFAHQRPAVEQDGETVRLANEWFSRSEHRGGGGLVNIWLRTNECTQSSALSLQQHDASTLNKKRADVLNYYKHPRALHTWINDYLDGHTAPVGLKKQALEDMIAVSLARKLLKRTYEPSRVITDIYQYDLQRRTMFQTAWDYYGWFPEGLHLILDGFWKWNNPQFSGCDANYQQYLSAKFEFTSCRCAKACLKLNE